MESSNIIEGYPFDVGNLSETLKTEINEVIKNGKIYYRLVDTVREAFVQNGRKPNDIMLLLSWAQYKSVIEGVHIDNLDTDAEEARTLLTNYMNVNTPHTEAIYVFEDELEKLIIRVKDYYDSI